MPLLPMGPPPQGGLAPPMPGDAGGLMPPPDAPPAGLGAMALAPLAAQQQAQLDAFKQAQAQEALQTALTAIAGMPNPAAAAAQTEPGPVVAAPQGDPNAMQGGGY